MTRARADVVQRLNFGNAEMKRFAAKLNLMMRKREGPPLKPKKLALDCNVCRVLQVRPKSVESMLQSGERQLCERV